MPGLLEDLAGKLAVIELQLAEVADMLRRPEPRTGGPLTPAEELMSDGTMLVSAAAEFAGVGRSTLYEVMDRGELVWVYLGKNRAIPRRALVRWLAGMVREPQEVSRG